MQGLPDFLTRKLLIGTIVGLTLLLSACGYLPPSRSLPAEKQSPIFKAPALMKEPTATLVIEIQATPEPTQIPNCTNDLEYSADLTVPDGTQFDPGVLIEKDWKVKNSGTCNWNNTYTLRLISGSSMGIEPTQALIPARNGTEAVVRIEFIAPQDSGRYEATWQAFGPDGEAFGEWLSVSIVVTTP